MTEYNINLPVAASPTEEEEKARLKAVQAMVQEVYEHSGDPEALKALMRKYPGLTIEVKGDDGYWHSIGEES